jgi:hypothetical protein
MPRQEEHEKPENLVESPGEAEQAARSLQDAADSHGTLQGFYAVNDVKDSEELEREANEDRSKPEDREKGHPVP